MNLDFKNGCKNEFKDNKEKSCSWFRNSVSHKNDFKRVWPCNVHADNVVFNSNFLTVSFWATSSRMSRYGVLVAGKALLSRRKSGRVKWEWNFFCCSSLETVSSSKLGLRGRFFSFSSLPWRNISSYRESMIGCEISGGRTSFEISAHLSTSFSISDWLKDSLFSSFWLAERIKPGCWARSVTNINSRIRRNNSYFLKNLWFST